MNKYIKFLIVPIMLLGVSGNSCYSMNNIYDYGTEKEEIGNYNEMKNNQTFMPQKNLTHKEQKDIQRKRQIQMKRKHKNDVLQAKIRKLSYYYYNYNRALQARRQGWR